MKNFKEKRIEDLSSIVGGETEGITVTRAEVILADGQVVVQYDLIWVSKKF